MNLLVATVAAARAGTDATVAATVVVAVAHLAASHPRARSVASSQPAPRAVLPATLAPAVSSMAAVERRLVAVADQGVAAEELLGGDGARLGHGLGGANHDVELVGFLGISGGVYGRVAVAALGVLSAVTDVLGVGALRDSHDAKITALSLQSGVVRGNIAGPVFLLVIEVRDGSRRNLRAGVDVGLESGRKHTSDLEAEEAKAHEGARSELHCQWTRSW
jgi:hypothetical protein